MAGEEPVRLVDAVWLDVLGRLAGWRGWGGPARPAGLSCSGATWPASRLTGRFPRLSPDLVAWNRLREVQQRWKSALRPTQRVQSVSAPNRRYSTNRRRAALAPPAKDTAGFAGDYILVPLTDENRSARAPLKRCTPVGEAAGVGGRSFYGAPPRQQGCTGLPAPECRRVGARCATAFFEAPSPMPPLLPTPRPIHARPIAVVLTPGSTTSLFLA